LKVVSTFILYIAENNDYEDKDNKCLTILMIFFSKKFLYFK